MQPIQLNTNENPFARKGMKEMFACYGLAMMRASIAEKGLLFLLVAAHRVGRTPVPAEQFDAIINEYDDETFGDMFKFLKKKVNLPADFQKEIKHAILHRNYLAHKFFSVHRTELLFGDPVPLSQDLLARSETFNIVSGKLDRLIFLLLEQADVPYDQVDAEVKVLIRENEPKGA